MMKSTPNEARNISNHPLVLSAKVLACRVDNDPKFNEPATLARRIGSNEVYVARSLAIFGADMINVCLDVVDRV